MPRKKPASSKQRKAELQTKRAIKRGDLERETLPPRSRNHPPGRSLDSTLGRPGPSFQIASVSRLQSSFVKLSPILLEESKIAAARIPLQRPIAAFAAKWPSSSGRIAPGREAEMSGTMTCMGRPKWRYDMSKKEVEKNEEALFAKWLAKNDTIVSDWVRLGEEEREARSFAEDSMPLSPTIYERNLEVWRQLWRVTELSQITLVLLDSRFVLVCLKNHAGPAKIQLADQNSAKMGYLVDLVGPERAEAWSTYLIARYPDVKVVMVESYIPKTTKTTERKRRYEPHIPQTFKERLVAALKEAHSNMLLPPERIRDNPEKVKRWQPKVKRDINWEALLHAGPQNHVPHPESKGKGEESENPDPDSDGLHEPDYLTVGFIGQPNVGKSSLLNALFGTTKVRASKTPGKTKHFQTLFWTPDVRLVDCPGLVLPSLVPLELQVLSGILPIARMPAIPLCILYASQLIPLERVLNLTHPSASSHPIEDKRTWRNGMQRLDGMQQHDRDNTPSWTAMDVLTAYADKKGWVTAKAGRPDVNRAGNAILRALADGKIRWAFLPPDHQPSITEDSAGNGIWIASSDAFDEVDAESEHGQESDESQDEAILLGMEKGDLLEADEESEMALTKAGGRFALLQVEDEEDEDEAESGVTGRDDED